MSKQKLTADEILQEFLLSYLSRDEKISDEQWLQDELSKFLPKNSSKEIEEIAKKILDGVKEVDGFISDVQNSADESCNPETWFYKKLMEQLQGGNFHDSLQEKDLMLRDINRWLMKESQAAANFRNFNSGDYLQTLDSKSNFAEKKEAAIIATPQKNVFVTKDVLRQNLVKSMLTQYQKTLRTDLGNMNFASRDFNDIAFNLSKNAALNGVGGIALTTGMSLILRGSLGAMERREIMKLLMNTGANTGLRTAVAGALKVGAERGIFPILTRTTPAMTLTALSCLGIENSKIIYKYARGEMNGWEALDNAGRISTSTIYALGFGVKGAALGAATFAVIPLAGPFIGGIIGGVVGNILGDKLGKFSYERAKSLTIFAKNFVFEENNLLELTEFAVTAPIRTVAKVSKKIMLPSFR